MRRFGGMEKVFRGIEKRLTLTRILQQAFKLSVVRQARSLYAALRVWTGAEGRLAWQGSFPSFCAPVSEVALLFCWNLSRRPDLDSASI